jgi:hypothetical protein
MILLFVFAFLFSSQSLAQMASASFSPEAISMNPAAVATREYSIFAILTDYVKEKDTYTIGNTGSFPTASTSTIYRTEMVAAGKFKSFFPEVYAAYVNGNREISYPGVTGSNSKISKNNSVNTQANLAVSISPQIHLGVQYFEINYSYRDINDYTSPPSDTQKDGKLNGVGIGLACELFKGFTVGAVKITMPYSRGSDGQTGYGISYLLGSPKSSALRIELSHAMMNPPYTLDPAGTSQIATIESIVRSFAGGVSVRRTRSAFVNIRADLKDYVSANDVPPDEYVVTYSGYVSLKSTKGHSIGLRGSYTNADSEDLHISGFKTSGHINSMSLGLTYSYLF